MKKSNGCKTKEKTHQLAETEKTKKRDRYIYEKGAVFESIFTESKYLTKDEFYQLITFKNIKGTVNQKIIEKREEREKQNIETK